MQVKVNLSKINKGSLTCESFKYLSRSPTRSIPKCTESPFDLPVITRYSNEKCVL